MTFLADLQCETAAERSPSRLATVAALGRVLSQARDPLDGVHMLLAHVVPALSAAATLALLDGDGVVRSVTTRASVLDAAPWTADIAPSALPSAHFSLLRDALTRPGTGRADAADDGDSFNDSDIASDGALRMFTLRDGERVWGVLWIDGEVSPRDESVLGDVVAYAGLVLANACLRHDVQREAALRGEAEARLAEGERRKVEFLAMLSHELRNPLAPVRNAVEVVRLLAAPEPRLRWAADIIDRQVRQLTHLVDQLLDVARIGQGKIELEKQRIDLAALALQCVESHRTAFAARRQSVTVSMPEGGLLVDGDVTRLTQVIQDLLGNAGKYTPDGGAISISAKREATPAGENALLVVRDDGIGIEADLLPYVFDLFEQGKRGLDRTQGGLGVGLTQVRRLVELHGGSVEAFSGGTGQGTTFSVRLPCVAGTKTGTGTGTAIFSDATLVDACIVRAGRKILLVEDNADVAESTSLLLTLVGHEVRHARDGVQALRMAAAFEPDVVLLDIGLPLMDGYEVARRLRAMPRTRGALLLALTGYGQPADRQRGKDAGFDGHLLKPVDPQELRQLIGS